MPPRRTPEDVDDLEDEEVTLQNLMQSLPPGMYYFGKNKKKIHATALWAFFRRVSRCD